MQETKIAPTVTGCAGVVLASLSSPILSLVFVSQLKSNSMKQGALSIETMGNGRGARQDLGEIQVADARSDVDGTVDRMESWKKICSTPCLEVAVQVHDISR